MSRGDLISDGLIFEVSPDNAVNSTRVGTFIPAMERQSMHGSSSIGLLSSRIIDTVLRCIQFCPTRPCTGLYPAFRDPYQYSTAFQLAVCKSSHHNPKLSLIYVHTHCSFTLQLLESRMSRGQDEMGEEKFLLDGFPRTASQAELLVESTDVRLAVNMHLREDVSLCRLICYSAAVLHHILFGVQNVYPFGPILSLQLYSEFCGDAVELVFVQGGKECEANLRQTVFENLLQSVLLQHP